MFDDLRKKAEELLNRNPEETPVLSTTEVQKLFHELDVHQVELQMQNEELRKVQEELAHSRDSYVELFDFAPVGYLIVDSESRIVDANFAAAALLGLERGKLLVGRTFAGFVSPESLNAWDLHHRHVKDSKVKQGMELVLQRPDGSKLHTHLECTPRPDSGRVLMALMDITERVKAEEEVRKKQQELAVFNLELERLVDEKTASLRASKERFHELFEHMASGVAIYEAKDDGADFVIKDINAAGQRLSVINKEDAVGGSVLELFPAIREMGLFDVFKRVWSTGRPEVHPTTLYQDSRIHLWVENHVYKLPSGELVAVYEDHTAQKKAEQMLQESEEKYRKIFESESDAIMIFNGNTRQFIDVNAAAVKLYGYSREEFLQLTHSAITAEPEASDVSIREALEGELFRVPFRLHRKKDGTVFPVEITVCTFSLKGSPVICGVIRDITERKKREEELHQNQKELRRLASELSLAEQRERQRIAAELHDEVSQLLSSCYLRLSVLKETSLPGDAVEALDTICGILQDSLKQTRSLTFELSCPMLNELGLAAALEELCACMTREYSVRFEFLGEKQPIPLRFDQKIVLYRSARELLINVMKHSGAQWAGVELERADDHVRICVTDDGAGFDASMAGKGFSPSGGFGLFNIREYIRHAGGSLQIESVPGDGTQVVLMVPLEDTHG